MHDNASLLDLGRLMRLSIFTWVILFIALCQLTACQSHYSNRHNWYQLSKTEKKHVVDKYTTALEEVMTFEPVSYFGDSINLVFKHGLIRVNQGHLEPYKPYAMHLGYNSCQKAQLCSLKHHTRCHHLIACYRDDLVMIGPVTGHNLESIRIYRSPI